MLIDRRSTETTRIPAVGVAERRDEGGAAAMDAAHIRHLSVTVVIPSMNEEQNIAWVLRNLPPQVDEVVLVDGRSVDRTVEVARMVRPDINVVLETRPGKGAAVRAGINAAKGDIIAMLDADCSMNPQELSRFIEPVAEGFELVKGSRFLPGGGTTDMTQVRSLGNQFLLGVVNRLYGVSFTELCYGYMAFHRDAVQSLDLRADGFEIEAEIVTKAIRSGYRIAEVPSFEHERQFGNSNLHAFRDGFRILWTMVRHRVTPVSKGYAEMTMGVGAPALDRVAVPVVADVLEDAEQRRQA